MKQSKIRTVLFLALVFIAVTVFLSYVVESKSVKLPAMVNTDKVALSADFDATLKNNYVISMQEVGKDALIAELENPRLPRMLENLKNEKGKYEDLIKSAKTGILRDAEFLELDEEIQKNRIELEEAKLEISKIRGKMTIMEDLVANVRKKYEANKRLYDAGLLNNNDFEKASRDYWEIHDDYYELKGDSLVASEVVKSSQNIINLLQARKKILSGNAEILAARHMVDINKVEADISDLESSVERLMIVSPIAGVVTEINFNPGERVAKGEIVAEVADLTNVRVIAYGSSSNRHKIEVGQKVVVYAGNNKKIEARVAAVSPVMEKIRSLSTSFETVNTFSKIEIKFDDLEDALKYITPGERLFVRIYF